MFCSNCGTQVEDTARFRYVCGKALAPSAPQQPVSPPPAYQQPVYQLTLRNGAVYKLCVNNPAKISYLVQRFG